MDLFISKILSANPADIKKRFHLVRRPDLLRITAQIRDWGIDWAIHAAKTYGYTTLDPKTQRDQILELLKNEEEESGMWVYFEYLNK